MVSFFFLALRYAGGRPEGTACAGCVLLSRVVVEDNGAVVFLRCVCSGFAVEVLSSVAAAADAVLPPPFLRLGPNKLLLVLSFERRLTCSCSVKNYSFS